MKKALQIMHKNTPTVTIYRVRWDDKETFVTVSDGNDLKDFGVGRAVRADEDAKDYRIGVKLALERALRNFETDKDERRRFMRDFYKAWPEAHPDNNPPKGLRVGDVISKIKDGVVTYKTPQKPRVTATEAMLKLMDDPVGRRFALPESVGRIIPDVSPEIAALSAGRCDHTYWVSHPKKDSVSLRCVLGSGHLANCRITPPADARRR